MRTDTQSEASKMKGIEVCEAGDFPLGFSKINFRKRMTAMYVNPTSVAFQKKKKKDFHNFMCEKFYFLFIVYRKNSWERCLENDQVVINSGFPTVTKKKRKEKKKKKRFLFQVHRP